MLYSYVDSWYNDVYIETITSSYFVIVWFRHVLYICPVYISVLSVRTQVKRVLSRLKDTLSNVICSWSKQRKRKYNKIY